MFRRFGSRVTVVEFNDQIVPREDEDVAVALQEALAAEGIEFLLGAQATRLAQTAAGPELTVRTRDRSLRTLAGSHILLAVGRKPNTDALGLAAAGIATDRQGYIKVNGRLETSVPGVYALGDVKGGPAFTHVSYDDHLVIYDNLFNSGQRTTAGRIVPYALFTDPELGRVGLSEKAAREAGYRLKVGKIPMAWVARAIERDETAGLMKVVIDADTDRILGAAILGSEGGELVQTLMALMLAGAPWTLFEKAMYIHPTMTEGLFTLMDNVTEVAVETEPAEAEVLFEQAPQPA
jgi:pyruvate/2-oxoglutarate dehydrogenase complex dihydrolipoamide dehydrogenase (E3) component